MNPNAPVIKNTHRQLDRSTMAAISGGAMTAPRLEPVLKMPNANDRSLAGNHSETALAEPGNPPPSPRPSRKRAAPRPNTPLTAPCIRLAADHQAIITAYPHRVPRMSMILPPPAYIAPYASRNMNWRWAYRSEEHTSELQSR